jgi:hypothetical protein
VVTSQAPEAFFLEKAGSARALIYSEESFEHRAVIVAEADSIPQDDGPAASAIRSLAEDGYMTYDVVLPDPKTGVFKTHRIIKQGPTALITTSTKPLREQMNTRTLTLTINDSPEQTREVLRAHAAAVNGHRPDFDVREFVDLQRWLALAGEREVTIPFSLALAELVPVAHLRMRRDFKQLLTVIQAIALLYQCQREPDANGRIVATFDDYRPARALILSAFTTAATDGVTSAVRDTVEALTQVFADTGKPCTRKAVADALSIPPRTAGDRLVRACSLGYVVNLETRDHQPGQYQPGEPLPENHAPLPTVDELAHYMCEAPADVGRHAATVTIEETQAEPAKSVANMVADASATPSATVKAGLPGSNGEDQVEAWRRGGDDRGAPHTRIDRHSDAEPYTAQLDLFVVQPSPAAGDPCSELHPNGYRGIASKCPVCGITPTVDDAPCFKCASGGEA